MSRKPRNSEEGIEKLLVELEKKADEESRRIRELEKQLDEEERRRSSPAQTYRSQEPTTIEPIKLKLPQDWFIVLPEAETKLSISEPEQRPFYQDKSYNDLFKGFKGDSSIFVLPEAETELSISEPEQRPNMYKQMLEVLDKGNKYLNRKKYSLAESEFKKLIEFEPDKGYYHSLLGIAYREQGKFSDAEKEFKISLELEPKFNSLATSGLEILHTMMRRKSSDD